MSMFRAAIVGLALSASFVASGHAATVPPVLAPQAAVTLVDRYIKAVIDNDMAEYSRLFAPDAVILSDWPQATSRDEWLKAISREFEPTRRARFPVVYSRNDNSAGRRVTNVLLVQEITDCRPGIAECFGQFRSETLIVEDGLIIRLVRSSFTHQLSNGGWTFFSR